MTTAVETRAGQHTLPSLQFLSGLPPPIYLGLEHFWTKQNKNTANHMGSYTQPNSKELESTRMCAAYASLELQCEFPEVEGRLAMHYILQ